MSLLVLVGVLVGALGVALVAAKGLLEVVFYLMVHRQLPVVMHWRPVIFTSALFWFWYLTPHFAEHAVVARMLDLLAP